MKKNIALSFACFLLLSIKLGAEIYKYKDSNGSTVFVNDINKVPEEYQGQLTSYAERFDVLSDSEKKSEIQKQKELQLQISQTPIQNSQSENKLLEEKKQKEKAENQNGEQALTKPTLSPSGAAIQKVSIVANGVLVPVSLNYQGVQIQATFLLDTGASVSLVYREAVQSFGVDWNQTMKSSSTVAGGRKITADHLELASFQVGPFVKTGMKICVTDHEGSPPREQGLLGMDFLREHSYKINIDQSQIEWDPDFDSKRQR